MRSGMLGLVLALAAAGALAGCTPGPGGYQGYANYRQRQADQNVYAAQRNAQAAQWEARNGNYYAAQQSQAAANAQSAQASAEQGHANRDRFLGGLGF